jgi:DNA-binding PadR family transcriptional regulator
MPAEHAILGLLAESDPGAHGYDLARHFGPEEPLGAIVRLEPGMLYHHLKKLDKAGWVSATVEQQGVRPPRQVYQLTQPGRDELDRWLSDPVGRTREIRLEFLVKLFFAQRLQPELAGELVSHQRETLERNLASLKKQQESMAAGGDIHDRDRAFSVHVLELRAAQTEAALAWLDALLAAKREGAAG